MRKSLITLFLLVGIAATPILAVAQTPTSTALKPLTIARAQITGVSGDIITIAYTEGRRKVYDPVQLTEGSQVWYGKKNIETGKLKIKQYIKVRGVRKGDTIEVLRIDLLSTLPVAKAPAKKSVVKISGKK